MTADLTKIDVPFGELDRETQLALFEAWLDGEKLEWEYNSAWARFDGSGPTWHSKSTYRVRPEPLTPDAIDWSHVAPEFKWMARESIGGTFLWPEKPISAAGGWHDGGVFISARYFASYKRGTVDWKDSLVERPSK